MKKTSLRDKMGQMINETINYSLLENATYDDIIDLGDDMEPFEDDWRTDEPSQGYVQSTFETIQQKCNECGATFKDLGDNEFGVIVRGVDASELISTLKDMEERGIIYSTGGDLSIGHAKYRIIKEINENKNMTKVVKINEAQLKQIVTESVKKVLKETAGHLYWKDDEGNPHTNSKDLYRGVEGAIFVYHGDWSDPEILYKGHSINYWDAEDSLWNNYKEYCEENNIQPTEDDFEEYVNKYEDVASTLDEIVWALDGNP